MRRRPERILFFILVLTGIVYNFYLWFPEPDFTSDTVRIPERKPLDTDAETQEELDDEGEIELDDPTRYNSERAEGPIDPSAEKTKEIQESVQRIITLNNRPLFSAGSEQRLPSSCPPGFTPNADFRILDILRNCGPQNDPNFIPELQVWNHTQLSFCKGHFIGFDHEAALLRDVIIDRQYCSGPRGGEPLKESLTQLNVYEYYNISPGFFRIPCQRRVNYFFKGEVNHLRQWVDVIRPDEQPPSLVDDYRNGFTLAVTRYEYYNLYHTVSDLYNAFLTLTYHGKRPRDVDVILVDGHPAGSLDDVWGSVFGRCHRLSDLPPRTRFENLAWNPIGYNSYFLDHSGKSVPLFEEFRENILTTLDVSRPRTLRCNQMTVVFISRQDYVSGRQNPSGKISRKIDNEDELLEELKKAYPSFTFTRYHLEKLSFQAQLSIMADTDILVGMHGAGLTHAVFLPKYSGVIELIPNYFGLFDGHFQAIARWRNLVYTRWRNNETRYESASDGVSTVLPSIVIDLISQTVKKMCQRDRI